MTTETIEVRDGRTPFLWIEKPIITDRRVSLYGLAVYVALAYHAGGERQSWPSYQTLAVEARCSRRRAILAVAELVNTGYVKKTVRKDAKGDPTSCFFVLLQQPASKRKTPAATVQSDTGSARGALGVCLLYTSPSPRDS